MLMIREDVLHASITRALNNYRMQHTVDVNEDGLSLVDRLTAPGDDTIMTGRNEMMILIDHIYNEITDPD